MAVFYNMIYAKKIINRLFDTLLIIGFMENPSKKKEYQRVYCGNAIYSKIS